MPAEPNELAHVWGPETSAAGRLRSNGVRGDENATTFKETSLRPSGLLARNSF
jgi:hypothetical protein